jgi:hypothetical protein
VVPINDNGRGINAKLSELNPVVDRINGDGPASGVSGINARADTIIDLTTRIDNDLTNVDNLVNSIEVSAESICNSPAINGGC